MKILRFVLILIALGVIGRFAVLPMFGQTYLVRAQAMAPAVLYGDQLFIRKISPANLKLQPEDLVAFIVPKNPSNPSTDDRIFLGRVAALEGQRVQIVNRALLINGEKVLDPHKAIEAAEISKNTTPVKQASWENREYYQSMESLRDNFNPAVTVPPGQCFILGDNRGASLDSRFFGPVPVKDIIGKPALIYRPFNRVKKL